MNLALSHNRATLMNNTQYSSIIDSNFTSEVAEWRKPLSNFTVIEINQEDKDTLPNMDGYKYFVRNSRGVYFAKTISLEKNIMLIYSSNPTYIELLLGSNQGAY